MSLETPKMLVLSTAHLTWGTGASLCVCKDMPIAYEKGEYGWIVPIVGTVENTIERGCPADLKAILEFAFAHGCLWVMFDRDADEVDELPTYEWEAALS